MSQYYRNEYLFSETYLRDITGRSIADENLRASLKTIKEWRDYADRTSLEKCISTYVGPALDTLGFGHRQDQEQANILILFPDIDKTEPMSLCYVVPPGEDINCTLRGKHWAEKIIRNLRKHNFQWGILTDGLYWRIYHTKESTPYETYLEVDLENILKSENYNTFQIFYFFFQPDNFVRGENEECKFDTYKEKSAKTTEYIEENLRAAIERTEVGGEGALQTLCLGYLNALNKDTYSEEERIRIYRGATLYLFRLLFLFYATARNLLREKNIEAFKSIVQDSFRLHTQGGAQNNSYNLWHRLQDLFAEIDLTYDGGLFNPYESNLTRFIEENKVTDPFLSEIIFGLGYYQKSKGNFVPIEYRDLSVRHLGSLYEGLLEHKLFIAEENKVVRKFGKKIQFTPESKAGKIKRSDTIIKKGKVYFSEDPKERKLTGSYYTPEDVVEYIVKNTVDALLQEKKKKLMDEIKPVIDEIKTAINESERNRFELFIEDKVLKFIEEKVLSLSILDPTMGSGHFLVNATNHIANFIVELLNEYTGYDSNIDSNPAYWRRRVVESCIYGVDLNPLAVELAKLCLWITTAFKEKTLSFLNHHLKQGNALVGVRISDLEKYLKKSNGKYSLFTQLYVNSIEQAAVGYKEKLSKLTETREDIEEKKEKLAELDKELAPYKQLCNLFTRHLLGEIDEEIFLSQVGNWSKLETTNNTRTTNNINIMNNINKTSKDLNSLNSKDFFHWELEFPDVFYGDNPGFDCVIGNPPYVESSQLTYIPVIEVTKECGNTYAYLNEITIKLLKNNGYFGMIVPISIVSTSRMKPLLKLIKRNSEFAYYAHFAVRPSKIFPGVDMNITIVNTKINTQKSCCTYSTGYIRWHPQERRALLMNLQFQCVDDVIDLYEFPKTGSEIEKQILKKLFANRLTIQDFINNQNGERIFFHSGGRYWRKAFLDGYHNFEGVGGYKTIYVKKQAYIPIVTLLNTTLFYWYWLVYSDCYNVVKKDVCNFPLTNDLNSLRKLRSELLPYANVLMESYFKYAKVKERNNATTGRIKYYEFYPFKSKEIINKIDTIFASHYNFSNNELEFLLNYDSRFRFSGER